MYWNYCCSMGPDEGNPLADMMALVRLVGDGQNS